ncbi:RNF213 [Mytilus coruscus]|uniref:RNF213 n=1 Tax=Mytilus coruscus TaxID=42192 RepID=A0A6J8EWZ9_MYTCO|nr:RNF213 [Mytilus coruscus]
MKKDNYMLIIVQCESGDINGNLIICARYGIEDELKHQTKEDLKNVHIIMLVQIPRITREYFTGFQCGKWHSLHIDALTSSAINTPPLIQMYGKPVSAMMNTQKGDDSDGEYHCMISALIWKCMKSALSLIKDQHLSFERSTRRLDIVFTSKNLLIESNEGQKTFTSGLAAQLFSLFEQKEENFSQEHWLSTEAAKPENINRAGTFRRSVEQYIEEKITPVLAGILANIAKNSNLNILSYQQNSNWKNYLWIEILNSPRIIELRYEDLLSQRHGEALSEYLVDETSKNGEFFEAEMPFSWCIFLQLENLWKSCTEKFEGSLLENIDKTTNILIDMPVGVMLSKIKREDVEEAKKCYLSDFVYIVYPVKNKSEHHVVCENILIGCKDFTQGQRGVLLPTIVGFHAVFYYHKNRFMQFESIVSIWPKCSDETLKYFQTKNQLATNEEIVLKDGNMKKLNSLEKLEMFLKSYTKSEASQLLKKEICDHCHSPYKDIPVFLHCNHTICKVCCNSAMTKAAIECPVCAKSTQQELHVESKEKRENIAELKSFTKRCNSFFMDVVSQLCFAGDTPPEDDVLAKLMSYITVHTDELWIYSKDFTVFDHCIDQIPKIRSFLLNKLMQSSSQQIALFIYLSYIKVNVFAGPRKFADSLHQSYPSKSNSISADVIDLLREGENKIRLTKEFLFENIYHLARTRFAITIMADCIHKKYVEKNEKEDSCKAFFSVMDNFFLKCQSTWPKYFFIRYFCKAYGIADYQTLKKECPERWRSVVTTKEFEDDVENSCDRFVACTNYIVMRDKFLQLTSAENREDFLIFLKVHIFIKEVVENSDFITDKESSRDILYNCIWKKFPEYNLYAGMNISKQGIQFLLVHLIIMMKKNPDKIALIAPLKNIAFNPESMMKSYFPTMPQDDLKELKQALLEARTESENPVIYRCPNGHPYVIGDCGRPYFVYKCHTCGQEIGGTRHRPAKGNVKDDGVDRPEYGHLLGDARESSKVSFPQRKLDAFSMTIMRLLTHLAMFIGSNTHLKATQSIIHPSIDEHKVPIYIFRHIRNDLICISKTWGKSKDDVLLFMHSLLDFMVQKASSSDTRRKDQFQYLTDKTTRQEWEDTFNRLYINPFCQIAAKTVQKKNKEISEDNEYGDSGLFQLLHETDESSIPLQFDSFFCDIPSVWRFRQHMTIGHIRQSSRTVQEMCPVLHLFLEEESYLRALRFVPGIIRLQKMLIMRFKGKLDKTEAQKYTLQTLIDNVRDKKYLAALNTCLEDFIKAWNMINQCLVGYNCEVDGIRLEFNGVYRGRVIDNNTPVSFFLPKHKDDGLCSYLLLHFLLEKQNSFLKQISDCNPQGIRQGQLPLVRVKDITAAHMISYHPEMDLLPMVLANCNYTFQVGVGTQLVYDWQSLERQLMDRFLFSKSIIILKEIETMIYRSETTNAIVFASLREKIKQERLSQLIQSQIRAEILRKSFPELCDSLQNIDIAISFLKSVSGSRNSSFSDFMIRTLQFDDACFGQKLTMSHIQSLWITLALEKTKRLQDCEKEAFDGIPSIFKEKLTEQHKTYLGGVVCDLQNEQMGRLLHSLFECILLTINIPQKDEQFVDMSTISLADALYEYLYDSPYEEETNKSDTWLHETVSKMMTDDSTQLCCNCCVHAWIFIYEVYQWKQRNSES